MGHSQRIKLSDMRAVMRTVHEACELGDDAVAWREHALGELQRIIGTQWGISYLGLLPFDATMFSMPLSVLVNVDPLFLKYVGHGDLTPDPCTRTIVPRLHLEFTATREHLCENGEWYRSQHYNEVCRPSNVDNYVLSVFPMPEAGVFSAFSLARGVGERSPGRREITMLGLLHHELGRLWKKAIRGSGQLDISKLSPRLRQVLDGFKAGLSEKQVAGNLGISRATVHNHVSRLHRVMGVSSRGELLARTQAGREFVPRLLPIGA